MTIRRWLTIQRAHQIDTLHAAGSTKVSLIAAAPSRKKTPHLPMHLDLLACSVNSMHIPTSFGAIRPWSIHDTAALMKYANNRKVWLNLRDAFPHPYTETSAAAFLDMVGRQSPTTFFAIATREEAIGGIGLSINEDVHRFTAEMGYWLGEPYWGKGLMTEAVAKFTPYAFECFSLRRIYAEPYASNPNSCRVLEKAGYALEGRMRSSVMKDGQVLDQFLYARVLE